jgi:hypothetical protein
MLVEEADHNQRKNLQFSYLTGQLNTVLITSRNLKEVYLPSTRVLSICGIIPAYFLGSTVSSALYVTIFMGFRKEG